MGGRRLDEELDYGSLDLEIRQTRRLVNLLTDWDGLHEPVCSLELTIWGHDLANSRRKSTILSRFYFTGGDENPESALDHYY